MNCLKIFLNKSVSLLLAVVMILGMVPAFAQEASAAGSVTVGTATQLQDALTNTTYDTIVLNTNFSLTSPLTIPNGRIVTIKSSVAGTSRTITAASSKHFSNSGVGCTITFTDIILAGSNTGGGAYFTNSKNIALTGAVFQNCVSNTTPNTGGALCVSASSACTVTLTDCTMKNNYATMTGGAVFVGDNINLTIAGGAYSGNKTDTYGGAVSGTGLGTALVIKGDASFSSNKASQAGGAVRWAGNSISIANSTFTSNEAAQQGGAIVIVNAANTNISSSTFTTNKALSATDGCGGAIYISTTVAGPISLYGVTMSGNTAETSGGAIYASASYAYKLYISGSNFTSNITKTNGGGICISGTSATLALAYSTTLSDNMATRGGAIYSYSPVDLSLVDITGNSASLNGGGVYVSKLTATNVNIKNNTAESGGGIYTGALSDTNTSIGGKSNITGNQANGYGGGIWIPYVNLQNLTVSSDVNFSGNKSSVSFELAPADVDMYNTKIKSTTYSTNPVNSVNAYNNYDIRYVNRKVTFNSNGGTPVEDYYLPEPGDTIMKPSDPIRALYTFGGWYKESSLTTPWNFSTIVTADTTLYAKWNEVLGCIISFNAVDMAGAEIASFSKPSVSTYADSEYTIENASIPSINGYNLIGYKVNGGKVVTLLTGESLSIKPTGDMIITFVYQEKTDEHSACYELGWMRSSELSTEAFLKKVDTSQDAWSYEEAFVNTPIKYFENNKVMEAANKKAESGNEIVTPSDGQLVGINHVWDNGDYFDTYKNENGNVSYDWASWKHWGESGTVESKGEYSIRRVSAYFEMSAEQISSLSSAIIAPEDEVGNMSYLLPINDNVFVFVNGQLAYWGGTDVVAGNNQYGALNRTVFNGMNGINVRDGVNSLFKTLYPHTDGWCIDLEKNSDAVNIKEFLNPGFNRIDIFVDDYWEGGGMNRLNLYTVQK